MTTTMTCAIALLVVAGASYASRFIWAATILPLAFVVAAGFHRGGPTSGLAILVGGCFVWAGVGYLSLARHDRLAKQRAAALARAEEANRIAERQKAEAEDAAWMAQYIAEETARMEREEVDAKRRAEAEEQDRIDHKEAAAELQRLDAIRALMTPSANRYPTQPSPVARQQSPWASRRSWDLDALLDGIPAPEATQDRSSDG